MQNVLKDNSRSLRSLSHFRAVGSTYVKVCDLLRERYQILGFCVHAPHWFSSIIMGYSVALHYEVALFSTLVYLQCCRHLQDILWCNFLLPLSSKWISRNWLPRSNQWIDVWFWDTVLLENQFLKLFVFLSICWTV
jgi:hypothetical protein